MVARDTASQVRLDSNRVVACIDNNNLLFFLFYVYDISEVFREMVTLSRVEYLGYFAFDQHLGAD